MPTPRAQITAKVIKITVSLRPDQIPRVLAEDASTAKKVRLDLSLEGGGLRLTAELNGKNYRKMLKTIDENEGRVNITLQGSLQAQEEQPKRGQTLQVTRSVRKTIASRSVSVVEAQHATQP